MCVCEYITLPPFSDRDFYKKPYFFLFFLVFSDLPCVWFEGEGKEWKENTITNASSLHGLERKVRERMFFSGSHQEKLSAQIGEIVKWPDLCK